MKDFLKLLMLGIVIASFSAVLYVVNVSAFTGPGSLSAGSGSGAIGVNSSNNISIGTTTPSNSAKVLIVTSSTNTGETGLQILQPGGATILLLRNDGTMSVGTSTNSGELTVSGGNLSVTGGGSYTGTIAANNVTAQTFASGNFAFPSSLGIGTSSAVGLPAAFTVYGSSSFTQTSTFLSDLTVNGNLDVNGSNAWFNAISASNTVTFGAAFNQSGGAVSLASTTINGNVTSTKLTVTSGATVGTTTSQSSSSLTIASSATAIATFYQNGQIVIGTSSQPRSSTTLTVVSPANMLTPSSAVTVFIGDASSSRPGCIAMAQYPTGTAWAYFWIAGGVFVGPTTTACH